MDTYTPGSPSPRHALPHPSNEPAEGPGAPGKRTYLEPALRMCGSVPAITGGSDIFGDMDE